MNKTDDALIVRFIEGNDTIVPDQKNLRHTKLDDIGNLFLDLQNKKDNKILDMLLAVDTVTIEAKERKIIEKNYHMEGSTLFIIVETI